MNQEESAEGCCLWRSKFVRLMDYGYTTQVPIASGTTPPEKKSDECSNIWHEWFKAEYEDKDEQTASESGVIEFEELPIQK